MSRVSALHDATGAPSAGPFAFLIDPAASRAAARRGNAIPLKRRICRPLDGQESEFAADVALNDESISLDAMEDPRATLGDVSVQVLPVEDIVMPGSPIDPDDMKEDEDDEDDDEDEEEEEAPRGVA